VSGGVNNNLRSVFLEDRIHAYLVRYITDNRFRGDVGELAMQLPLDIKERIFGLLSKQKQLWVESTHLPTHFRTDRTPGAGYKNDLISNKGLYQIQVKLDNFPAEQVINII
jgi:hypothetical protein